MATSECIRTNGLRQSRPTCCFDRILWIVANDKPMIALLGGRISGGKEVRFRARSTGAFPPNQAGLLYSRRLTAVPVTSHARGP